MNSWRSFFLFISMLGLTFSLNADQQANAEAEQRRLDQIREGQVIQDKKLDEIHQETKRIDQQIQNRQIDQKRLDEARERRRLETQRWERDHSRE